MAGLIRKWPKIYNEVLEEILFICEILPKKRVQFLIVSNVYYADEQDVVICKLLYC